MDKDTFSNSIDKLVRNGGMKPFCVGCGTDNEHTLERHHLFGRIHSNEEGPLCKNCHAWVTAEQNKVPPTARSGNGTDGQKTGYWLLSVGALLQLIARHLVDLGHEMVNHDRK